MKQKILLVFLAGLVLLALGNVFLTFRKPLPVVSPPIAETFHENPIEKTKTEMLAQLNQRESPRRKILYPTQTQEPVAKPISLPTIAPPEINERALGRKKREGLPMAVVLWDHVRIYDSANAKKEIFTVLTGDMVRVFEDKNDVFFHIQPGLDVFLAATTKETKPAGERLPDRDGWVRKTDVHLFEPEDAKDYIMEVSPVTLGNDTGFSMVDFYERAMKNPDPVVHRVVGPRMIKLVLLHEDYSSSWSRLLRDRDFKIRDAALSAINERGIADNRALIEDLILRLTELTKTRVEGETELETLSILASLKASQHPRVPVALASFKEDWKQTQNPRLNLALNDILSPAN